jgi:hypothetical protein
MHQINRKVGTMTSTLISLSRIEYEVTRDIVLDYIAMLNEKDMYNNVVNVEIQAKLSDARYMLERLSDALI